MTLPLSIPFAPMEAKLVSEAPGGEEWEYEPKWDGFRCVVFRDGGEVELQSKAGQSLTRYFPEMVEFLRAVRARKFVLDGELIVVLDGRLSFDDLLQRIHPAASRVAMLARTHPAQFVAFDLLVNERGTSLVAKPWMERRRELERFYRAYLASSDRAALSRSTLDPRIAKEWLAELRGQLDGIVAKRIDRPYEPGERAMLKVKTLRSADCVVGGFRYLAKQKLVGSLLLGLYDDDGRLNHVGFTSSMASAQRGEITKKLESLIEPPGFTGQAPGGPSRWSKGRSAEWEPLKPALVVEVEYDHFTGQRFRHGTKFLRWRPEKPPRQCSMEQVRFESHVPLKMLLAS